MNYFIILSFLFCFKAFSIVGHDDRFYVHGTKWADLLSGIVQVDECTGFVLEGDLIVTIAHCFEGNSYLDEDKKEIFIDIIDEDSRINYKNLKKIKVYFGDANLDPMDKSTRTHFDASKSYIIKDLFLRLNTSVHSHHNVYEYFSKDYAFIKLEKPIPKKIKRFKLFNPDLLKDYEILKHSYRGNLSTAGFHGDNKKTIHQRMAHIGCKGRDMRKYKRVWFEFTDCDIIDGGSGSPLFYILRHKKTKKIELAVSSILIGISRDKGQRRQLDDYSKQSKKLKYQLAWSYHYYAPTDLSDFSASVSLLLTNHKEFLSNLKRFKKNPSFSRNQKIAKLSYTKYYDPKWLLKKIRKIPLKDLKEFIEKNILKLKKIDKTFEDDFVFNIKYIYEKQMGKISQEKIKFLSDFCEGYLDKKQKKLDRSYPFKKRTKKMSYERITELERKYLEDEDSIDDKKKAQKFWKMYFSDDQKKAEKF